MTIASFKESSRLLIVCVLSIIMNKGSGQELTPAQLMDKFKFEYDGLPYNCEDADDPTKYVNSLKYLFAYTQIAGQELNDYQHKNQVTEVLEYLERVARNIGNCGSNAGVDGRYESAPTRFYSREPDKPGIDARNIRNYRSGNNNSNEINQLKARIQQLEQRLTWAVRHSSRPQLLQPVYGYIFNSGTRNFTCSWNPVHGASYYIVEIWMFNGSTKIFEIYKTYNVTNTYVQTDFPNWGNGGWLVTAVYQDGTIGPQSDWRSFIISY